MEKEIIEIRNETDVKITVSACRSSTSGMLYIHIGEPDSEVVEPNYYNQIEVKKVNS
mgnify:CR=1 FL=1